MDRWMLNTFPTWELVIFHLGGAVLVAPEPDDLAGEVLALVAGGQRLKDAARAVATDRGVSTKALYEAALRAKD